MKFVMLSGGSGKRLWPLSNDTRSKQFLKVLKNDKGLYESMVQRVKRQLFDTNHLSDIYIATSRSQVEILESQLGKDVRLIVEPEKRDTFPAIALVVAYLYSVVNVSLDETICVLPVDPFVENGFFEAIKQMEKALNETNADLALIGVKPTYPSEKYGYIVPAGNQDVQAASFPRVSHFIEKPDEETAIRLIGQNAYWNCGVFAFKLGTVVKMLAQKGLPIQFEQLHKQYRFLKKTSFDYEVVEQVKEIVFLPYEGTWKDLGTWNTLTDEMDSRLIGKGFIDQSSQNTHVINELEIPVAVLGISNVVVAASPDGILVSEKLSSPKVKEIATTFEQRPMYEEKQWGSYKILDYINNEEEQIVTRRLFIGKGRNTSYQYHNLRNQTWSVIAGEGEFIEDGKIRTVKKGDGFQIPAGTKYAVRAELDMEIIEVQIGQEISDEDTIYLSHNWNEISLQYTQTY